MNQEADATTPQRVECPAAKDPPTRLLIVGLVAAGFGLYCGYDIMTGKYTSQGDYYKWLFNVAGAVVLVPVGLVCLIRAIFMFRRRLVADQEGIGYAGKARIPWSSVRRLVMAEKGLLHLHYEDGGSRGVLKLDSWKLKNYAELISLIEARTPGVPVE